MAKDSYDRDVTPRSYRTSSGTSRVAQKELTRKNVKPELLPRDRRLVCEAEAPVAVRQDDTGSLGNGVLMFFDKAPLVSGQTMRYLPGKVQISYGVVGDINSDDGPLQFNEFVDPKNLDPSLKACWLEKGGGAGYRESYEMAMYFDAYMLELPNAKFPLHIIVGDEAFYVDLLTADLKEHFGGSPQRTNVEAVFARLEEKFMGNVFHIHLPYGRGRENNIILNEWTNLYGKNRVLCLDNYLAVTDTMLGILAIMSGERTLDEYCRDMAMKAPGDPILDRDQSPSRIAEVRKALSVLTPPDGRIFNFDNSPSTSDKSVNQSPQTMSGRPQVRPNTTGPSTADEFVL
ncbi:hypothetical protein COT97_02725 [Candidatus Falkowbacteria bacterium CG10_big_fil_rev_8_21_14_0_10_39_11]|uniref:Uncharacterized protein n=1 Tax=Candidatus Falkowbacteria bacterium CG10_big_fil_rev_8_21_14_0_10_39_11 TaxID=1974565 RepID=A0A2H0V4Z1_9BACT|nr:MAG: hypothetical protein COT97_02725 [Candidatus Falkowbacteria bacterium CG10_big_fil_rev_8_21_14_0_10_39_11]